MQIIVIEVDHDLVAGLRQSTIGGSRHRLRYHGYDLCCQVQLEPDSWVSLTIGIAIQSTFGDKVATVVDSIFGQITERATHNRLTAQGVAATGVGVAQRQ